MMTDLAPAALRGARFAAGPAAPTLERARAQYALLERRADLLGTDFASDPTWHILLDVFIATKRGRALSVTAVCIGSRASSATAMRYIDKLCTAGVLVRRDDALDGRRTFIALSADGLATMEALLSD